MTTNELRDFLTQRRVKFRERKLQYGDQFRCEPGGEVFNVYQKSGKIVVAGKATALAEAVRSWSGASSEAQARTVAAQDRAANRTAEPGPDRRIFVVYGHDIPARDALELLLRRMGLEPIVLCNLPAAGDTIIEKLERYLGEHAGVGFACVLVTPDDQGHKAGKPAEAKYRARQNVVLELGMVLARLGRRRVAILRKQTVEEPSDIAGLIYIPFQERVDEVRAQLFRELQSAGYSPKTEAL